MRPLSFKRHRFPPETIRTAVWLYFRFTTSLRDVEDLLAERGICVSYETVRLLGHQVRPGHRGQHPPQARTCRQRLAS